MIEVGLSDKNALRRFGLNARQSVPEEEAQRLSLAICAKLADSAAYRNAEIILSYCPFGGEADVRFLNDRARRDGKTLALPICYDDGVLLAAVPHEADACAFGKFGIFAPIEDQSRILEPSALQLIITPCTAFEGSTRHRVGMGGGYYDRYLPRCTNAVCIAVAYEVQHISAFRADPWDIPLDAVVTETNWY